MSSLLTWLGAEGEIPRTEDGKCAHAEFKAAGEPVGRLAAMSAQPVHEPRYDPQTILESLPEVHRSRFIAEYEAAVEAARRPDRFHELYELLHVWWLKSIAFADPGFDQAQREILDGTAETVPIEDVPDWARFVERARRNRR